YFLNNWGWWWGSSIAGNGDNRSNGDFDYRGGPTINGETLARGQIRTDVALKGEAAPKPNSGLMWDPDKIKMYSDKLVMPNLRDFDFYKNLAHNWKNASGVVVGGSLTGGTNNYNIAGVYTGNIYLEGTALNPLVINGPVVIDGNAILTGYITGQGTLYVGRNLYLVGNMEYKNAPNSVRPSDNTQTARDNWVSANGDKDLVAYAARENIVFGDITNSSEWSYPYDIFLKNWGDESHLGADGIPDTADDNTSYDRTGDGVPDGTWFDADEDGTVDGDYQWRDFAPDPNNNTPFQTGDLSAYAYYPTKQDSSELKAWSDLAGGPHGPGYIDKFEGIFYTNHAFAGRTTRNNSQINGAVICKDEAIIFTTNITFNYDERAHSRYNDDPNKIVDLGLPIGEKIRVLSWEELGRTL
ncbi:MAG: hypothetical protein NTW86_28805, partial [Candidatus Sumerlaeota bacterium]|nr:hypothetical protein [Candidatus Sumerlaeota bacterium]